MQRCTNWGPKSFKFFNVWIDHEDFMPCVEKFWNLVEVNGKTTFVLEEKMKLLKTILRRWNKEVFGHLDL